MTSNTELAVSRPTAPLARIVAFVLLALVTYTATAEAVHKHGGLLLAPANSFVPAFDSSGDADSSANDSRASGECLICQLRQNFSISLLSPLPQLIAPQDPMMRSLAAALPCASRADAPQRGRAPPLASLT